MKCKGYFQRGSYVIDCELTHCGNMHHMIDEHAPCLECLAEGLCERCTQKLHEGLSCEENFEEHREEYRLDAEVAAAERRAGWDPNP